MVLGLRVTRTGSSIARVPNRVILVMSVLSHAKTSLVAKSLPREAPIGIV